jgi:hypothetical protein
MSYQRPVSRSFARKRPGGSVLCTISTIFLATSIFCFLVKPTYVFLLAATSSRKCMFPRCLLLFPPRPQRTSFECGFSISVDETGSSSFGGAFLELRYDVTGDVGISYLGGLMRSIKGETTAGDFPAEYFRV